MGNGVRVVGATADERLDNDRDDTQGDAVQRDGGAAGSGPATRAQRVARPEAPVGDRQRGRPWVTILAIVALLGVAGTIYFERSWSNLNGQNTTANQAKTAASSFLVSLTNFDAKSVDADFAKLTNMATGPFAKQANQFFNSSIRQQLENALASSRGQVRSLYVQSVSGGQATVYAVVDQLYVNRSLAAPQSDVLRVVVQVTDVASTWKVSDVTVLEGPTLGSPSPPSTSGSGG